MIVTAPVGVIVMKAFGGLNKGKKLGNEKYLKLLAQKLTAVAAGNMKRLVVSREANALYERWFTAPIPPKNAPLNIPMNYLLKDLWKYPTDWGPG